MKRLLFFCLVLLLSVSCGRNARLMKTMKDVESYVHESPDSALAVLAGLDSTGVSSGRVDALYTLLNSIARYRLYIDEQDDSALVRASDFFRKHGDDARLMKALFLASYIRFNSADYRHTILMLTEAEPLSEKLDDHFYGGLICRQMAWAFERAFNNVDRLSSVRKAYKHFVDGHFETHAAYTLLMVGEACTANNLYEESENVYQEVIAEGRSRCDTVLWAKGLLSFAEDMMVRNEKRPQEALQSILYANDSLRYPISCYSWATAALSAAMLKHGAQSDEYFRYADSLANSDYEKYLVSFRKYEASLELHRSDEALSAAQQSFSYLIDTDLVVERNSAVDIQRNYYQEVVENERLRFRLTQQRDISLLLLLVLLCIGLFWMVKKLIKRRRILMLENSILSSQVQELEQSGSSRLKRAFESGMRFFNKLAEFKWINKPEKILPVFESMLTNLSTDDHTIREMMTTLNETHDNLMIRLAEQVPTMKKDDLMVYCYLAHRLDHMTLCTILNRTPGVLNAKVYRIREKIRKSGAQDADAFLDAISN